MTASAEERAMSFEQILDQAIAMLQHRGRVTYRTLKLQFNLDDEHLEALKDELLYSQSQIVDDAGHGLVWTGALPPEAAVPAAPGLVAAPVATPGERREPRAEDERQQREAAEAAQGHATAAQPRQEQTEGHAEEERRTSEAAETAQHHATVRCDICREQVLSSQFRLHMEAHKAEQPQESASHPRQRRVSEWVLCALCNERVARREMAMHRETHTGGRSAREIGIVPSGATTAEPMRRAEDERQQREAAEAAPRRATAAQPRRSEHDQRVPQRPRSVANEKGGYSDARFEAYRQLPTERNVSIPPDTTSVSLKKSDLEHLSIRYPRVPRSYFIGTWLITIVLASLFTSFIQFLSNNLIFQQSLGSLGIPILAVAFSVLVIYLHVGNCIRRLHDLDKSGWYVLLFFIPFVNLWFLAYLCARPGTPGDNRFGSPPKPKEG
jgi:uncharacterized membrane protein YhaH (DUF805 family)